MSFEIRTAVA